MARTRMDMDWTHINPPKFLYNHNETNHYEAMRIFYGM